MMYAATHLVPASKLSGSCDPTACDFSKHHFNLSSNRWGTKANMEGNQVCFTFPLIITEVEAGSEADKQGIKKCDQIHAVVHKHVRHLVKVNTAACLRIEFGSSYPPFEKQIKT